MAPHEKSARTSATSAPGGIPPAVRERIAQGFTRVEDVVYVGLTILLAVGAVALLIDGSVAFGRQLISGTMPAPVIDLLDRVLLVVMLVELLYTVQVSFREHTLVPEPFLIVGLIAATRRILVVTAEFAKLAQEGGAVFPPCDARARAPHGDGAERRHRAGAAEEALDPRRRGSSLTVGPRSV
jgi:uncharacterized membrane protein (DUF373 family)